MIVPGGSHQGDMSGMHVSPVHCKDSGSQVCDNNYDRQWKDTGAGYPADEEVEVTRAGMSWTIYPLSMVYIMEKV
jgi:hypothetical protein